MEYEYNYRHKPHTERIISSNRNNRSVSISDILRKSVEIPNRTISREMTVQNKAIQMERVYMQPTRNSSEEGFDEDKMYAEFSKLPGAKQLEEIVGGMGFKYGGDTDSESKANTDFDARRIYINKSLDQQTAILSFVYELMNALQQDDFTNILQLPKQRDASTAIAEDYAERILRKEAKSVLMRSKMAIAMRKEELIKNPKYINIARMDETDEVLENLVFTEMKQNGTVHKGKYKAYPYYISQYWFEHWKWFGKIPTIEFIQNKEQGL